MVSEKSTHTTRYDMSSRVHIIVLYLLIASLTIAWGIYFVHFSRNVQTHMESTYAELSLIKQRLEAVESTQITISTNGNGYDPLRRQVRQARIKSKTTGGKQQAKGKQNQEQKSSDNPDLLFGSIHFKVPVRE